MTKAEHTNAFHIALTRVCVHETLKNYNERNKAVIEALHHALQLGYPAGIRLDPKEPEWPVVFIHLSTGQVSWHISQYAHEWDGHDAEEKYRRVRGHLGDMI